jgi:hypothetical protein
MNFFMLGYPVLSGQLLATAARLKLWKSGAF